MNNIKIWEKGAKGFYKIKEFRFTKKQGRLFTESKEVVII